MRQRSRSRRKVVDRRKLKTVVVSQGKGAGSDSPHSQITELVTSDTGSAAIHYYQPLIIVPT